MKYSYKLSDAIHVLAYLLLCPDSDHSSKAIAASVEANPSVIRSLMSDLRKANLLSSHQGSVKPTLVKPPFEISLFDIYQALNVNHHLFHVDPDTNQNCIVGRNIQPVLQNVYGEIEKDVEKKMMEISLEDIVKQINQQIADHASSNENTN